MSVEWQKLITFEVKRAYSISNGGDGELLLWFVVIVVVVVVVVVV